MGRNAGRGGRNAARGGRGRLSSGMRPVSEEARVNIMQILRDFQASSETEHTFPPTLTNDDRAVVHGECKKFGFQSKSYGKGEGRRLTVFKSQRTAEEAPSFLLPVSEASAAVALSYFEDFPATDEELSAASMGEDGSKHVVAAIGNDTDKNQSKSRGRRGGNSAAALSSDEVARRWASLQTRRASAALQPIQATRKALPVADFEEQIVNAVRNHQVVLVAGETGCGKTTQVPQFLLDSSWREGKGCRCFCTQPRRISAVSIADRVASERGEAAGDTVGYTIRLESKGGPNSSLMFCTNGVLLRMITQGEGLEGITHIIVDEIHERDRFADFILIMLRDLLPQWPNLKLILMSATLHVPLFSDYFGGCPVINVPGFTHPVSDFYLEEILLMSDFYDYKSVSGANGRGVDRRLRQSLDAAIFAAFLHDTDGAFEALMELTGMNNHLDEDPAAAAARVNFQHTETGATPLMVAAGKGRVHELNLLLGADADVELQSSNGFTAEQWALKFGHSECVDALQRHVEYRKHTDAAVQSAVILSKYQEMVDADEVDLFLIEKLLLHVYGKDTSGSTEMSAKVGDGATLVFLPGWDEISRLKDQLQASPVLGRPDFLILPLHSMIAPLEQRRIFQRPPNGVRKIVLATNMAETAITIDDVVVVINSGRLKEKSYDPYTGVSTLQAAWISKASERQRRGRAGRCQPGWAFHMYSRLRSTNLAEYQLPELRRSPLDELCLQVKLLDTGRKIDVREFLNKAVEPPVEQAVAQALTLLTDIGAMDDEQNLTQLGRHLAALPLPPQVGKMLLFAVIFKVLDPVLTVACALAYRDPWVLPMDSESRRAATLNKQRLSGEGGGGSDHMALIAAFNGWLEAKSQGAGVQRTFCVRNFVSPSTMQMIVGMRHQLLGELTNRSLVQSVQEASANAANAGLVRAVLACGMYPCIGRLQEAKPGARSQKAAIITRKDEKVVIHPASVNSGIDPPAPPDGGPIAAPLVAYDEVMRGDAYTYVRQTTCVLPQAMPLIAGHLWLEPFVETTDESDAAVLGDSSDTCILVVDRWLRFRVPFEAVAHLCCLRLRLANAFSAQVEHPGQSLPPLLAGAIQTISAIFSIEGDDGTRLATPRPSLVYSYQQGRNRGRGSPGAGSFHARGGLQPGRGRSFSVPPRESGPGNGSYQQQYYTQGNQGGTRALNHPARGRHSNGPSARGRGRRGRGDLTVSRSGR